MNDEELERLVELADKELHALYEVWMANLRESRYVTDFPFTENEKKAWRENEPNFPRPIIH
ncbi:MAG TPA: hypothetical protein VLV31_00540 [Candidatus Acidoferrales bacterium]|nr:hypothetical protein [Candidatus Acidoferrales bacterium]